MSFSQRVLAFTVQLGQGSFGESGFNTVTIPPGLWATASVSRRGAPAYNEADIEIAGLPASLMRQLSNIGLQAAAVRRNIITVLAGDDQDPAKLSTVFVGVTKDAWVDYTDDGQAIMKFNANTGLFAAVRPVAPSSYPNATSVVTIMSQLAKQMGYVFQNNGVQVTLSSPYFPGSARNQAIACAQAAGILVYFEDDNGIMVITPPEKARTDTPKPVLSPYPGTLRSYPKYVGPGKVRLECEYNNELRMLGEVIVENSIVDGANGTWRVIDLRHDLSTRPDGPWFSYMTCDNVTTLSSPS